jgi:hypothetical protein
VVAPVIFTANFATLAEVADGAVTSSLEGRKHHERQDV